MPATALLRWTTSACDALTSRSILITTPTFYRGNADPYIEWRYCEILLGYSRDGTLEAEVWGTQGLNPCPQGCWEALDSEAIKAESGAAFVEMNGPRYGLVDQGGFTERPEADTRMFGEIEMDLIAILEPSSTGGPYIDNTVRRSTDFTWAAGSEVYELRSPDGGYYVMQSMSQQVEPDLTIDDLPNLESRLNLPDGWTYTVRTLGEDIRLVSNNDATVLQDDLKNSYSKIE